MKSPHKPVAIFRHSPGEGPAYFAIFLDRHAVRHQLIKVDQGEAIPASADAYAGLCFMGGPMSVNDELPWIAPILALIRDAVSKDIPVIGHCLGGQLMARALGGAVAKNAVKEIGWGRVRSTHPTASEWMGDIGEFHAFHWHGETFTIPPGATRILDSAHCANQAFVLGPHLGMQCHVEMTESMIQRWNTQWQEETVPVSTSVQSPDQMYQDMASRIIAMRVVADRLYTRWIAGLKP